MRLIYGFVCLTVCLTVSNADARRKSATPAAPSAPVSSAAAFNDLTLACSTPNADVYVDGEMIGKAPIDLPVPVAVGQHTIKVTKPGFAPYIDVFTAKPGKPVRLAVELVPISGVLHVTSSLKEVRVLVDGRYVGDAPVDVEIEVGPRAVQISKRCYQEMFKNVMSVAGQEIPVAAELAEMPADSNPCVVKALPPPKWYQKKWVWGVIAATVVVAAGTTVGAVLGSQTKDPLAGSDVRYDVNGLFRR